MSGPAPDAFLVSSSFNHALLTATTDCGWMVDYDDRRQMVFRTPEGERVKPLVDVVQVYGRPYRMKLYLGYGYTDCRGWREVWPLIDAGRFVVA